MSAVNHTNNSFIPKLYTIQKAKLSLKQARLTMQNIRKQDTGFVKLTEIAVTDIAGFEKIASVIKVKVLFFVRIVPKSFLF